MPPGVRLPECRDGKLTVDETAPSVDVTCDDIGDQDTVTWALQKSGGTPVNLGSCPPQGKCESSHVFGLARSATRSTLTLVSPRGTYRSVGDYSITCARQGDASQQASCALDVVCGYHGH